LGVLVLALVPRDATMNRRKFLGLLAAAPAALILPELLVPKRTFFLPPATGWAQPSLADMWLDYANEVRPAGVIVSAIQGVLIRRPEARIQGPGHIVLMVPEETDAEFRERMLEALKAPREFGSHGTMSALTPWVDG
jgi:hypothetical protein